MMSSESKEDLELRQSIGIKNLQEMQELADKLSRVFSQSKSIDA